MWVKFGFFLLHGQIHFFQRVGGTRNFLCRANTPPPMSDNASEPASRRASEPASRAAGGQRAGEPTEIGDRAIGNWGQNKWGKRTIHSLADAESFTDSLVIKPIESRGIPGLYPAARAWQNRASSSLKPRDISPWPAARIIARCAGVSLRRN